MPLSGIEDLQGKVLAVGRAPGDYYPRLGLGRNCPGRHPGQLAAGSPGGGSQGGPGIGHRRPAARRPDSDLDWDALAGCPA